MKYLIRNGLPYSFVWLGSAIVMLIVISSGNIEDVRVSIIPGILILYIDFYLFCLLFIAAGNSDKHVINEQKEKWKNRRDKYMPTRIHGLIMFFVFLFTFVGLFASVYLIGTSYFNNEINNIFQAVQFSFLTLTNLGYGGSVPDSEFLQFVVLFEILSAIILLLGAFALLISRISTFGDDEVIFECKATCLAGKPKQTPESPDSAQLIATGNDLGTKSALKNDINP